MKQNLLDTCICVFLFKNIKGLIVENWVER